MNINGSSEEIFVVIEQFCILIAVAVYKFTHVRKCYVIIYIPCPSINVLF